MADTNGGGGGLDSYRLQFVAQAPASPSPPGGISKDYRYIFCIAGIACLLFVANVTWVSCCSHLPCFIRSWWVSSRGGRGDHVTPPAVERNIPASKYRGGGDDPGNDDEAAATCSVCLSVFDEGEMVRQLPRCKHSFHTGCIDMWLNSHDNCPLCRTRVSSMSMSGAPPLVAEELLDCNSSSIPPPSSSPAAPSAWATLRVDVDADLVEDLVDEPLRLRLLLVSLQGVVDRVGHDLAHQLHLLVLALKLLHYPQPRGQVHLPVHLCHRLRDPLHGLAHGLSGFQGLNPKRHALEL